MGNEMGNNNTIGVRDGDDIEDGLLNKSSMDSIRDDNKILEDHSIESIRPCEEINSPVGNNDVSDKISDKRENTEDPLKISAEKGQVEENENRKSIPLEISRDNDKSSGDNVRVEMEDPFASSDLTAKDSASNDPEEPSITVEGSNDVHDVLNLTESTENIGFPIEGSAMETGLMENGELVRSEGDRVEEVALKLGNLGLRDGGYEGILTEVEVTESDRTLLFEAIKEILRHDESDHQPQSDENDDRCRIYAGDDSEPVGIDGTQDKEYSTKQKGVTEVREFGDIEQFVEEKILDRIEIVQEEEEDSIGEEDEKGAAEEFVSSPEGEIHNSEENRTSAVLKFEFEKPRTVDVPEPSGTSLGVMLEAEAGGKAEAENSVSSSDDSRSSNSINPQMQKSPSFDSGSQPDSDQRFQDKAEIVIEIPQDAVAVVNSDSEKSKAPLLLGSLLREEKEQQEAESKNKEGNQKVEEKVITVRRKERRRFGSSVFGSWICCGVDQLENDNHSN